MAYESGKCTSVNGETGVVVLDTDDITEGTTNKYFSGKTTDDLAEGSTNKYSQWLTSESNIIFSGGRVGIGGESASRILELFSQTPAIKMEDSEETDVYSEFIQYHGSTIIRSRNSSSHGSVVIQSYNGTIIFSRLIIDSAGNCGVGIASPVTKLHVNGAITANELSADPADPAEGSHVIWQSDGTGSGDDGDIMVKITAGGVTKTVTLIDFSAV